MQFRLLALPALVLLTASACTNTPVGPSPSTSQGPSSVTPQEPQSGLGLGCVLELDGYQCTARVVGGNNNSRDVTGLATWSTSDTAMATVNSVGFVTVLKSGDVAVRAEYAGMAGFITMTVAPGGLRKDYRTLSGWVLDAQTDAKLGGVRVDIVSGPNAGRTTVTGQEGAYQLYDLETGTFTVRFTKSGYLSTERSYNLPGDRFNSLDARLSRAADTSH